jgi:2-oxoglutarate ferredoxin oxidoreductase subunit alpha
MMKEINIVVGGEAGQGVQSAGFILAKSFARAGYHVFADQDYESRVRGGHNFYRVRISVNPVSAISLKLDVLVALNQETVGLHQAELKPGGLLVLESGNEGTPAQDVQTLALPLAEMAKTEEVNPVTANTIALGVVLALAGIDESLSRGVLESNFGAGKTLDENNRALSAGYRWAKGRIPLDLDKPALGSSRMLINGNEAIALGALAAGCRFMAAYPMTPVTSIMEYLAAKGREFGMVVIQPEDEIAAVNMAIGASYGGARAMTATSGGGFCLMVEGLSLSGMTETPLVVVMGQRPGPAIGLPTRTEQGELGFVIHAGHGEFPRAVLAPTSPADAFFLTVKAFNLADRFQLPVVILTDHHLASSYYTVEPYDFSKVTIDRGKRFISSDPAEITGYKRHAFSPDGISPRAFPMQEEGLVVVTDSDEHDETGHLVEDSLTRVRMMDKRLGKMALLASEIDTLNRAGQADPEVTLVGWGSVAGAIREAAHILDRDGIKAAALVFNELWPFPAEDTSRTLTGAGRTFLVENNATGQLGELIRSQTGIKLDGRVLRYDGRPLVPDEVAQAVKGGL